MGRAKERFALQQRLRLLDSGDDEHTVPTVPQRAAAPADATAASGEGKLAILPEVKFGESSAKTTAPVPCKVVRATDFDTRAGQKAYRISLIDANGTYAMASFVGTSTPSVRQVGSFVEVTGVVKRPSHFCADGYACEIPSKGTTITEVTPADGDCSAFPQNGVLPALSTGPDLSKIATRSAVNGYEQSVKGRVNVVLIVLGEGTIYRGAKCERYKMLCWLSTGEEIWVTVWDPPADISSTLCDGARVFGENLALGSHHGELNLSGNANQFTTTDRDRCPTPSMREPMDSFTPRRLTEAVMRRYYQKHNPAKLDDATFLKTLMTLTDEELHNKCLARYHVAPEPLRDAGGI